MVSPTVFAHKGTSRILLTGVDFSTGAEFSRLGDISSIERVALAGAHGPNLLKQKPENDQNTIWLYVWSSKTILATAKIMEKETLILAALMEVG